MFHLIIFLTVMKLGLTQVPSHLNQSSLEDIYSPTQDLILSDKVNYKSEIRICAKGESICIPSNYSKFDLPNEDEQTLASIFPYWFQSFKLDFFLKKFSPDWPTPIA